jgi:hypothetical protein
MHCALMTWYGIPHHNVCICYESTRDSPPPPFPLAGDSSNCVTNTRCCRYSCLRFWWWVEVPPETCRAVSRSNKLCNVASRWIYIRIRQEYFIRQFTSIFDCFLPPDGGILTSKLTAALLSFMRYLCWLREILISCTPLWNSKLCHYVRKTPPVCPALSLRVPRGQLYSF